jgi:hypothetical protein
VVPLLVALTAACSGPATSGASEDVVADAPIEAVSDTLSAEASDAPAEADLPDSPWITFAVVSDPHVIDDMYVPGGENGDLDNESILLTRERFAAVRDTLNGLVDRPELVLVPGDLVHNYPLETEDWDFYTTTLTRFDLAALLMGGFTSPVYWTPGNHDYAVPDVSREFSHRLFAAKFGTEPYYAVLHRGVLFVALNSQLGDTWDPASPRYDRDLGSFGAPQLAWLEGQLARGLPTILFWHYPVPNCARDEADGKDIAGILKTWPNILHAFNGHAHTWLRLGQAVGLPFTMAGSSRYDADNYLVVRVNRDTGEVVFDNDACIGWGTRFAEPCYP